MRVLVILGKIPDDSILVVAFLIECACVLAGNCKNRNFAERTNETGPDFIIHHAFSVLNARQNRQRTTDGDSRFAGASCDTPNNRDDTSRE
jgi:hypothetical protein